MLLQFESFNQGEIQLKRHENEVNAILRETTHHIIID